MVFGDSININIKMTTMKTNNIAGLYKYMCANRHYILHNGEELKTRENNILSYLTYRRYHYEINFVFIYIFTLNFCQKCY